MTARHHIESARNASTHEIAFRFVCSACETEGAWLDSLNDAERAASRHARDKHPGPGAQA